MATAEQHGQMKQLTNQDEVARLMVQELPDPSAWPVEVRSSEQARGARRDESNLPETIFASLDLSGSHPHAASETAPASDTPPPTLAQRLLPLVSAEVRVLRQAGPGELSVLLKPDGRTEIVLHLRRKAGYVEATVRCERGDFQSLNTEWGQLRESLLSHGVLMLPLTEPPAAVQVRAGAATNSSASASDDPSHRQPQSAPMLPDEPSFSGATTTTSSRTARKAGADTRRLLESWA